MEETSVNHAELRSHVIETATKAFHTNGIRSVTMDDIAHLLTMSKRTLYQLFHDKEELVLACVLSKSREDRDFIDRTSKSTDNVLEVILEAFAHKMEQVGNVNPAFFLDLLKFPRVLDFQRMRHRGEIKEGVDFMNKGIDQGIFRSDVDFNVVIPFMQQQVMAVWANEVFMNHSAAHLFENTHLVVLRGCTTPKGTALIDDFLKRRKRKAES